MKKREKKCATWLSLMCIMLEDGLFESKTIALLNHEYYAIARIKGMPSCKELEDAVDDNGCSSFDLVEWLLNGHIDTATNRHEVEEIFAKTRHIVCDDIDEEGTWWTINTAKARHRSGDLYIQQFKMNKEDPSKPILRKNVCICKRG